MTPGLMVVIVIAAFFGCMAFPVAWLALGFWQKRRGLKFLALFSFFAVLCPVGLYWLFFHSGNSTVAFISLIFFIPGNIALLLASFFASRMLTRDLSSTNAPTT